MNESFLVTALPFSADPAGDVHVSLFVTHRLTPTGAEAPLSDFPHVARWGEAVARASFRLIGSDGHDVAVTARTAAVEADLWPDVFPDTLPVRRWSTPELAAVPWRTFPAHRMDTYAKLVHVVSAALSPVTKPSLLQLAPLVHAVLGSGLDVRTTPGDQKRFDASKDSLRRLLDPLVGEELQKLPEGDGRRKSTLHMLSLLDERWTEELDEASEGGTIHSPGQGASPIAKAMFDLHLARRYYERPEEQRPYRDKPNGVDAPRPAPIQPDFHQRCGLLGGTPGILRELGLVVDLAVDDVTRLRKLDWIQGEIVVDGLENTVTSQPKVRCQVNGRAFTTVSSSGDYVGAALKLGDGEKYRVLDLDPDASALKLERFVRSLPRLLYAALNGDPVDAAPATLRSSGFSITRVDRAASLRERLTEVGARDGDLLAGAASPLHTEDVTRGLRLEVWDDKSDEWHSLHHRRIDIEVEGSVVVDDEADQGFLQGAALSRADETVAPDPTRPYHAHEALAGWEGWSLSAPRPGRVLVEGDTPVDAPPEGPRVTPVVITSAIEPGTLPMLRYGRSYSFRAWAVDLAGNSPPASAGIPAGPVTSAAKTAAMTAAEKMAEAGTAISAVETAVAAVARSGLLAAIESESTSRARDPGPVAARHERFRITGIEEVDALVQRRMAARATRRPLEVGSRAGRIEQAAASAVGAASVLVQPTSMTVSPEVSARMLASATEHEALTKLPTAKKFFAAKGQLVTTPRPFLRWDAILPPAWVPRHPYTEGESLLTLVIRSGVGLDESGTVVVTGPADYSAGAVAAHPSLAWREDSQRHLAPPKTSQMESEQHGMFDYAFGPAATSDDRRQALAASVREAGTFLDLTVASLSVPGATEDQQGVSLHHTPTADPDGLVADLARLPRGDGLGSGQYVVHDVDGLVLPYLPDPPAHGVSLVFPDAGRGRPLQQPFATEGVTLPYGGEWPAINPYRLVLQDGAVLHGEVDGAVVTIAVPPGEQLRIRVSTCLAPDALELLGIWRSLPEPLREQAELAEGARDGWMWWLTPYEEVRLVHAVPRPVERPRLTVLRAAREPGDVAAALVGAVDIHGPSTDRLDLEASWTERVDDVAKPAYEDVTRTAAAAGTTVSYDEDLVVFGGPEGAGEVVELPGGERLVFRHMVHTFEDTKHRLIDYTVRGTTRYREYFAPAVVPTIDDVSLVSLPRQVSVPSSARPAKPIVHDVLPLFRWDEQTEPHQPFGLRRSRRTGLRIYLDRPWYTSGDGELLGVVLSNGTDERVMRSVSQWGADPVWRQRGPETRTILPLIDETHLRGFDDRILPGRPAAPRVDLPLVDVGDHPEVSVLGYLPEYSEERRLWFVDVAFDPGTAFWPFVRLAVVRYQPESIPGMHLSPVVICDFTQLTPERTATLTRPSATEVRVVVSGVVGERDGDLQVADAERAGAVDRMVIARLERHDGVVTTDLGWSTVLIQNLPVRGRQGQTVSWGGTIGLPEAISPVRPGERSDWRVTIEELEVLPADGPTVDSVGIEGRLVYADHLAL